MSKVRICFTKNGKAKYISHLDLMRTMQRVFIRAGLKIKHTEGFNPHPKIVFGMPLSVGAESVCELMDFELTSEAPLEDIPGLLNSAMPEGITVTEAYIPETKFRDIAWLRAEGELIYDDGSAEEKLEALRALFSEKSLVISKKTKKGIGQTDIIPLISEITFTPIDRERIMMYTVLHAQDPALNPAHIYEAVRQRLPECEPDFFRYKRVSFLDKNFKVFR